MRFQNFPAENDSKVPKKNMTAEVVKYFHKMIKKKTIPAALHLRNDATGRRHPSRVRSAD